MNALKSLLSTLGTGIYWFGYILIVIFVAVLAGTLVEWVVSDKDDPHEQSEDAVESNVVEDVLVQIVSKVNERGFGGIKVDEYTTSDRVATDGKNLFYSYEVDPSVMDVVSQVEYGINARNNALTNNCSKKVFRSLLNEGVTVYHYYYLSGSSERFASVAIGKDACQGYEVTD